MGWCLISLTGSIWAPALCPHSISRGANIGPGTEWIPALSLFMAFITFCYTPSTFMQASVASAGPQELEGGSFSLSSPTALTTMPMPWDPKHQEVESGQKQPVEPQQMVPWDGEEKLEIC